MAARSAATIADDAAWLRLSQAVEDLRPLQIKDGSVPSESTDAATDAVNRIVAAIRNSPTLPPINPSIWRPPSPTSPVGATPASGSRTPSTRCFCFRSRAGPRGRHRTPGRVPDVHPKQQPNRNIEAVISRTVWPEWIGDLEAGACRQQRAFVPIRFVAFTAGYDTHSRRSCSPETVAVRETRCSPGAASSATARPRASRSVSSETSSLLSLDLPPDAEMLLNDQNLAQQTFVLWDLVHDRTNSHGDLPFDPS